MPRKIVIETIEDLIDEVGEEKTARLVCEYMMRLVYKVQQMESQEKSHDDRRQSTALSD